MSNIIFMIEGGKPLDLVKHHINERRRVEEEAHALLKELGVDRYRMSLEGRVTMVEFDGEIHPEFTKPGKYGSRPKKGTEWAKRFAAQAGMDMESGVIADAFGIPLSISYKYKDGYGSTCIGNPLRECGFLYLSADGPYAMWIPDVEERVAYYEGQGYTVGEKAKSFKPEFDGCRRIEREEWEILVAQHKLDKKRAMREAS